MARRDRYGEHVTEDRFVRLSFFLIEFVSLHRGLFTTLAILVIAGVIGVLAYRSHLHTYNQSAMEAFESAKSAEQFKKVAEAYTGSSMEPRAFFNYGRKLIDGNKYEDALAVFSSFQRRFPDSALLPNALVIKAMLFEQQEMFEDAAESYRSLLAGFPDSFIAPRALINLGTCYEKLGNATEARAAYERVVSEYSGSPWKGEAEERAARLKQSAGEPA